MSINIDRDGIVDGIKGVVDDVVKTALEDTVEVECDECGHDIDSGDEVYCARCMETSKERECCECGCSIDGGAYVKCENCEDERVAREVREAIAKYKDALQRIHNIVEEHNVLNNLNK